MYKVSRSKLLNPPEGELEAAYFGALPGWNDSLAKRSLAQRKPTARTRTVERLSELAEHTSRGVAWRVRSEDACQSLEVDGFCKMRIEAGFERPLFVLRLSPPRNRNDDNGF